MARRWTENQREAIEDRGNDLLVSAAAGSGKTAVLVERITRLILDDRVPVSNMLVVTFTKAAAAEMRDRIHTSLREALAKAADPGTVSFLRSQIADLPHASISNFHSFAASLLREHFAVCGVDPAFRVADEIRADLLKQDALDDLFDLRFSETGERKEAFLAFLRAYGPSRSDDAVRERIRSISDFLDSLPDPEEWLRAAESVPAMSKEEFLRSETYRFLTGDIDAMLAEAERAADELVRFLSDNPLYADNVLPIAAAELGAIRASRDGFSRSFDEGRAVLNAIEFATFTVRKKNVKPAWDADKSYATRLRAVYRSTDRSRPGLIDRIRRTYTVRPLDDALFLINETAPYVRTLTELVREFRTLYRARKDAEKQLDFADLEAYALDVLRDGPTRDALRARYRFIFVDEYQDSNRVQEDLVRRLKSPDNCLFFVGDVKQSIYRFRLAEARIFNDRMARYRASSANERTIDLNRNFRSEGSVLTAINALFEGLMEPTVSGMAYDETQALVPGKEEAANARTPVELHIIDLRKDASSGPPEGPDPDGASDPPEGTDPDSPEAALKEAEAEALLAVQLVRRDLGKPYFDFSSQSEAVLAPSDVVVLLRASTHAAVYEQAFLDAGLSAVTDTGDSYFDTLEIAVFLNLLIVIDNLHNDEALIGTLYSPLFRFSPDDLASIRTETRDASFADALLRYGAEGPDEALRGRAASFLAEVERFRENARFLPLSDFLWSLMIDSGYYHYIGALPSGLSRQANLRALTEKAAAYEANGGKGLSGWIRFVQAMKKRKLSVPPVRRAPGESAIRIMTIHKSKGLEFPYVLIGGLGSKLHGGGQADAVRLSPDGILALPYVNRDLRVRSETLLAGVIGRREARDDCAEELRILYVAMTRAKHKLVLVGTASKGRMELLESGRTASFGGVMSAGCYLDWLLGSEAFLREIEGPAVHPLRDLSAAAGSVSARSEALADGLRNGFGTPASAFKDALARRLRWTYPFAEATVTPSKMTVTEINRKQDGKEPFRVPLAVPSFARTEERAVFTAAQRGTFLHRVLEHIPFREGWTADTVRAFVDDMTDREFFTPEEARTVSADAILRFFDSPVGRRAIAAEVAGTLFRETDFTLALPGGETVQGTIDLFFRDPDGRWVLVDYKSNLVGDTDAAADELLRTYRSQLLLYRRALEQIKRIRVDETFLYAFRLNKALLLAD